MAAVEVVGRRADRQVDVAELLVGAHRRPDVGVAGFLPGILLPGLVAELARLRDGVEGPEQAAGATSKPRTSPGGDGRCPHQSMTDEPTTMTSRTITGGEVMV